ncbi:MAG: bifunctional diaminohydroxyphosphoribosylaminopyrimidine deaminase/5-amino-6-(5-phosphoribosylamino)uracil reductase RibD [Chitinophagaceae bacterium]|nr:bifunctional diaminohydroxyphosphoribosylaminopyrimidine deaminase/5-amino-6-(5-phosphoribosylamino)uracil reductase RibD [Chitinophagaceae bacterium]
MQRCLELAKKGAGFVAPNPMVGAVLVYEDRIIGEGWHQQYGEAHAEVNCINDAMMRLNAESGRKHNIIEKSTLYVSLEPCAHFGKTPPCADLIIQHKIPKVVIGSKDSFQEVNGKGIEKLKAAGVEVISEVLEDECKILNKRFFTFHEMKRPYVILKWAQTGDGKMASGNDDRLLISNEYSNRLVHQWRSEEASILIGTNTALLDDPELTNRLWEGNSPIRLVLDMNLRLPLHLKLFDKKVKTIVFNAVKQEEKENLIYYKIEKEANIVSQMLNALYQLNIQSVIVEGGAKLLQSFIDAGLWDEARVISNEELVINNGLSAPLLSDAIKTKEEKIVSDIIEYYTRTNTE